jgi:hypothetical protein
MIRKIAVSLCLTGLCFGSLGQVTDTLSIAPDTVTVEDERVELFTEMSTLDPKRSAILSAIVPGLGQVYNKQYWKVPLIYGGALIIGHYIRYQDRLYQSFRSSYLAVTDADPNTQNRYPTLTQETLQVNAEGLRRDRDFLMIVGGIVYLLQIVDAHVSAHLHEFAINDELSMNIQPSIQPSPFTAGAPGVSFAIRFK